jgi:hypothetical protein
LFVILPSRDTFNFDIGAVRAPLVDSQTVKMVYVRQQDLPNLKEYKYSAVDRSLLSKYVLKPFYTNVVIKMFPMWMAPNLITLSGLMFVVANFFTLLWYNPTLDQNCPPWVYYSWAAGLFIYQTFDAVDGTQASVLPCIRRRSSNPLRLTDCIADAHARAALLASSLTTA